MSAADVVTKSRYWLAGVDSKFQQALMTLDLSARKMGKPVSRARQNV